MKAKTFILTFLMMMSSPFLFGQHWTDPGELYQPGTMQFTSKIYLDNELQTNTSYEIAVFNGTTLLEVANIVAIGSGENTLYHVDLNVQGTDGMGDIYFKLYNGEKEFVSVEKIQFQNHGSGGTHINPSEIHFKTVAQIEGTEFDVVYPSLQKAIDAAANDDVVTLLKDNKEDVTVVQAPNVAFTIDGAEKTMSGTITVNGKSQAYATAGLTIKNVNFNAANIADASIMLGVSGDDNTRYTNGVTVHDCNFTGNGQTKVAIKNYTGGCKNLTVTGGTFTGLHSLMQVKGVDGLAVSGVTVSDCKNGVSVGTSTNVAISDSNITATGYGVRADGEGAYTMTLEDNTISAELPVVVRKAKEVAYKLTIAGDNNNFTAKKEGNNPEGYQVVFTTGDDGTYLAPTTGQFVLSVPENFNVYPVYVAQVGNLKYTSVDAALTAAQPGDVVQIFAGTYTYNNQNQAFNINKAITVEGERNDQGENLVNITGKLNITADGATAKNLNVNNGGSTAGYIGAKDVTVDGCTVVGGNGFRYCYTTGLVTFKNSTITGSTYGIHFDGSAGGNIVIDNCVITGWTSFASTITNVTMKGTSFEEGNYNYVRFYQDEVVIEGCIFNENMAIDIAVNGNTTTITNCTFENGNIEDLFADIDIVNSTIIVDGTTLKREASIGNTYYETLAEAFAAAQDGDEVKILVAGTYALSTSGKDITITGAVDGVVFDNIGAKNMDGANVTFNHVTFNYATNSTYKGLQHSGNLTYNNCTINGQVFLYGESETFNNCIFSTTDSNNYNVWTYGAKEVVFEECTFNSAGKSVLIYSEDKNLFNDVAVTKCIFNASSPVEGKAAIEMDSSLTAGINLTIDGETTATGFGSGNVSNNSLWNNKKGNQGANNDITVTVNNVVVLAPTTVAKIGETEYNTLQGAITDAGTTTTQIDVVGSTTENINIAEGANITLAFAQDVTLNGYFAPFIGNLTINGGTINNTNSGASAIEINAGELNLNNVNIASARHAVRIDGAVTATIDGGVYKSGIGTGTGTYHAVNVSDAANVTIKDGTFVGPKGTTADSGAAINVKAGSNVTIEGGNYSGGKNNTLASAGTLVVTGGTFDQDPSAYVTTPYVVIKKSDNEYNVIKGVAKIGETYYESLAAAITAAQPGNTIVLLADITEDVTVGKSLTIDGENNTYTGKMEMKANITVKNVNFDGKGYNGYAVETRSASVVVIEDCTAKNYGYGFLQIASNNHTTTVKNVTISNVNYGVKVDYSNGVVLENVDINAAVAAVLNSNYGTKTISIKNSELNILCTWERNGTVKTTYNFYGDNTIDKFVTVADIDTFVLAATDATLTAPEGYNVTTTVGNSLVKYENGVYVVKPAVAKIGETYYETLTEAINAADDGATIQLLPVTINEYVAPWITDTQHTSEKSITILGSKDDEGKLATTLTAGMYLGYEDGQCREHTIVVKDVKFEGKGLKVACQQKVTIEGNQFNDITEGQAIAVVGKNIESVVKDNVIDNVVAAQGIELRNTLTATVEGNIISNTGHNALQITSQVGATASEIDVINNTMSNWGKGGEGRAMRINDIVTANINGNVMSHTAAPEEFVKVTGSTTLDASANYWNGVSPLTDGMFTGVEGDLVPVLKSYYTDAEKQNLVVLSPSVAKIGEEYYPSLAAAVSAAQQGKTIVLLADITEDVTVDKSLTIDGKAEGASANSKYTGKMTVNTSLNINIRNIDFVKGYIDDELGGAHGYFTIVNCNFDGVDKSIGYAVTVRGGDELTIENSTAKNYDYGMVYIPSAVANIAIKDVEVSNVIAAFNISYSGDGTFENVEVKDVTYGLHVQNYGARTFTLNDCVMNNVDYPTYIQQRSTAKVTFKFNNVLGYKETINSGSNQAKYGIYVLTSTAAKLTNVADDFNVTVSDDLADNGYVVEYNEGVYSVVAGNVLNSTTGKKYATIQDAIDAAVDNDVIVLLEDVKLSDEDVVYPIENNSDVKVMLSVKGKDITLDLNEKTIEVDYEGGLYLYAVVFVEDGADLTVTGNGKIDVLHDENSYVQQNDVTRYNVAYMFWKRGNTGSLVIENGTFHAYDLEDSIIYTNGDGIVTVKGGNFSIDMVDDQSPWIFNGQGQNTKKVIVEGGTFNADINHQFWANEVYVPETLALQYNGDEEGTWTVVESVAYVEEIATSTGSTVRKVGYATIEDAIEAIGIRNTNKTVTMLKDVVLENTITIAAGKEVILDLNGKTISGVCNSGQGHMFMVQNTADLTVKDSSENKEGKITYARGTSNTGWVIDLEGDLILESGTIELTGDSWSIGYAVDVRPNSWGSEYTEATTFTMKGGKLVSSDAAVRVASSSADSHENVSANFIMNGGEIEAKWDGIFVQQSNAVYDILNVRINGGNIKSELSPLRLYGPAATSVLNNVENPITLNITGGTFDYIGNDLENEKWLVRGVIMVSGGATFEQMLGYTDFEITGGTFDGDVNAYCAEGFAAVNNGDGTWEVMPAQEQYLGAGYNWYSSYLNINTGNLLEALGESGISVAGNDWIAAYYTSGWDYETHELDFSKMYMIETNQEHTLKLTGELLNAGEIDIDIEQGWNWIGYPSNERVEINTALTNHSATDGDRIVTQGGFVEYASMYGGWIGSGDFTHFEPTKGYQYFANNDAVEFNYNIVPAQTRGNNETAVATHYSVDYTKYPFNMTMVAVVDGAMNDNYEVAALVNGEVRGSARPVYVEALDTYMLFLTISGDEVEEVSFKYYDITTEEEYELVNRIEYSNNAMVGSVNEPYVLSRGTTGIGGAAMSNINIYPNPTTTGTEINLQATCDTVEVFNALGVKVAEYQNVDTIDALETAGIYVIRITNDGNVQNCRLVVK